MSASATAEEAAQDMTIIGKEQVDKVLTAYHDMISRKRKEVIKAQEHKAKLAAAAKAKEPQPPAA